MDHDAAPDPIDPRLRLTRDAYLEIVRVLSGALPDPPDDTPEVIVRRDNAAIAQAAWSEHCTIGLMTGALTEAEFYAINYPRRARLIRRLGRLPDDPDFGPPAPEVVRAVVTGTTPHLRALDAQDAAAPAFAG